MSLVTEYFQVLDFKQECIRTTMFEDVYYAEMGNFCHSRMTKSCKNFPSQHLLPILESLNTIKPSRNRREGTLLAIVDVSTYIELTILWFCKVLF